MLQIKSQECSSATISVSDGQMYGWADRQVDGWII